MSRPSLVEPSETVDGDDEFAAQDYLAPGTRFGRYEIRRLLGHGAFGAVYEAQQLEPLQRPVALKVLHDVARAVPQLVARFVREAQIAASITHPHIVTMFDIGSEQGVPFLAMERLHGEALDDRLAREPVLPASVAVDILLPVLSAVAAVHDAGIVHRDLKPANIFLANTRPGALHPKLLDFGIVKVLDRTEGGAKTETRSFLGTPHYTSPEQAMDASSINQLSDQWSLGVILYECITGGRPWREGPVLQILFEITTSTIEPPNQRIDMLPEGLSDVVMRTLTRNPIERYPSVRALGAALLPYASPAVRAVWTGEFESYAVAEAAAPRDAARAVAQTVNVGPAPRSLLESDATRRPSSEPKPKPESLSSVETPKPWYAEVAPEPVAPATKRSLLVPGLVVGALVVLGGLYLALGGRNTTTVPPQAATAPVTPVPVPAPQPEPAPTPTPAAEPAPVAPPTPIAEPAPTPPAPAAVEATPDAGEAPHPRRGRPRPRPHGPSTGIPNV